MKKQDFFDDLSEKLSSAIPSSVKQMKKDVEKNFRAILSSAFSKMELVTREEFDAQTKVLARTRKKLEELEKIVAELEKRKK
jgi:BMFP domain-containing protein YqiC